MLMYVMVRLGSAVTHPTVSAMSLSETLSCLDHGYGSRDAIGFVLTFAASPVSTALGAACKG